MIDCAGVADLLDQKLVEFNGWGPGVRNQLVVQSHGRV